MIQKYKYHKQLDGIRCIAVFGPLISHWFMNTVMDRFPFGYGVYLFFVLSGFLITNILLQLKDEIEERLSTTGKAYGTFILRRTLRIFPIYYLIIFIFYMLKGDVVRDNLSWLFTYTINIKIFIDNAWPSYITHLWTLAVEEQFYLLFPLLIFLVPRKNIASVLLFIIVASFVSKIVYYCLFPERLNSSIAFPLHSFDSLCLGALMSFYGRYYPGKVQSYLAYKKIWIALLVLFFLLIWFFYATNSVFPVNNFVSRCLLVTIFSLLCFYVVGIGGTTGFKGGFGKLLENPVVVYIGKISYGIYLYHNFVPTLLTVLRIKTGIAFGPSPFLPLLFFAVTLFISILSWHFFESPINSLKRKFKY